MTGFAVYFHTFQICQIFFNVRNLKFKSYRWGLTVFWLGGIILLPQCAPRCVEASIGNLNKTGVKAHERNGNQGSIVYFSSSLPLTVVPELSLIERVIFFDLKKEVHRLRGVS